MKNINIVAKLNKIVLQSLVTMPVNATKDSCFVPLKYFLNLFYIKIFLFSFF